MVHYNTAQQGVIEYPVNRATSAFAATTTAIFRVTGDCEILSLRGIITTAMEAKAITCKLRHNADAGAGLDADLCSNYDINAAAKDGYLTITGNAADALQLTPFGSVMPSSDLDRPVKVNAGTIDRVAGDTTTGAVQWSLIYRPISSGASIIAI